MEGPLIHHMPCSNWTSRNASVLGKKETFSRLWHLAGRRDGFLLKVRLKRSIGKRKRWEWDQKCAGGYGWAFPGQVKKETEKGLSLQSALSQKSTETCNCNTAQLLFRWVILDLPKEPLKSNIHLIHSCHFRDCSLKIYSAEANISEKNLSISFHFFRLNIFWYIPYKFRSW